MSNGSKYEQTKNLRTAEVAKLIRADIKAALKAGELPAGTKVSVKTDTFAGGTAIRITVTACPLQIWTEEFLKSDPNKFFEGDRRTPEAVALLAKLETFHSAYNYDRSDIQSDYFSVRYYGDASFDWRLEKADRERTIVRKAAESKARADESDAKIAAGEAREAELVARIAEATAREKQARAELFQSALALYSARMEAAAACGHFLGSA
jgi:hypothetical protein